MEGIRVFDRQGRERDWGWLVATFGPIEVSQANVPGGTSAAFQVVRLQDAAGPAVQVVNVTDPSGAPLEGVTVVRHWPDAPPLPAWPAPASLWRARGVYGESNANGDIGFGLGQGDYYAAPEPGASAIWVADDAGPSDMVSGLGMLGDSNHRHLDIHFQLKAVAASPSERVGEEPLRAPSAAPAKPPASPAKAKPAQPVEPVQPEAEAKTSEERWQEVLEKLDTIIALLEERVP